MSTGTVRQPAAQRMIERHHERRDIVEGDPHGPAVRNLRPDSDRADRRVDLRLVTGSCTATNPSRPARSPRRSSCFPTSAGIRLLEHDDAEITVRFDGRQHEDRAEPRVAAGLVQQQQPKIVEVLAAVLETLGHRRALDEQMAVDQHAAGFAAACTSIALIVFLNVTVSP